MSPFEDGGMCNLALPALEDVFVAVTYDEPAEPSSPSSRSRVEKAGREQIALWSR